MERARIRVGSRRQTSRGGKRLSVLLGQNGKPFKRSVLTPEMVMEEEKMAARMIQRMVRARLARNYFRRLLAEVYTKVYDKKTKQVRYIDNRTGISTETKPFLLLLMQCEGQEQIDPLPPDDAAIRIQHCVRTWRARLLLRDMIRDMYQKHMDPTTKEYYYLNTQTRQVFHTKPVFLGNEDIELERFKYRNAACRLSTKANLIGNGVLVLFNRVLCILTDSFTLPDEDTARFSRVQFNHRQGSIPFMVRLRSDLFFMTSAHASYQLDADQALDFALCAVDADDFHAAAGDSVEPIKLAFTDRRMSCACDVRRHDEVEMVGHPHGKLAVVNRGHVDKFIPNMVKPKRLQYRSPMESGASGSPVFNFGGRLLGIHHHTSLREPALDFTFLKPIVEFTTAQIKPPVPLLQSACLTHDTVNVYWQVPPQYKPWNGLKLDFILEMCNRTHRGTKGYFDHFDTIYTGPKTTFTIEHLKPATKYAFRCRSAHYMDKSGWCTVMQLTTLPAATAAWEVKYCATAADAIAYMAKSNDALVHRQSILWLKERTAKLRQSTPEDDPDPAVSEWASMEPELIACDTSHVVRQSIDRFHHLDDHVFDCLDVLGHCCQFRTEFRDRMVNMPTFDWFATRIFPHFSAVPAVLEKALGLVGYLIKDNESGREVFMSIQGIPTVLELIESNLTCEGLVREACYVLAAQCQNFRPAQQHMGVNMGIKVMSKVLVAFPYHPQVLYWACLTLGNVACDYEPNQARGQKYRIVDCLVQSKITFILKLNSLEDAIEKETQLIARLAATAIGEEVRNEMDLHEHRRQSLVDIYTFMKSENVLGVANFALEYMMNDSQKQVQARTKAMATRIVMIRLGAAMDHWRRQSQKVLQGRIIRRFVDGVTEQTLYTAFRTWEVSTRELRVEQSTLAYRAKQGLILDLSKKKTKERYRALVNSK